jgi:glycosyltransferase involved in cell wall biosynthesis
MKGPLISIIMAAWNAKATIGAAVLSVVNQQYWNWELIIVDDGSSDDLETELKMFEDDRIRYFRLIKNRGLAGALNVGLGHAKGRFVARMDADDYMEDFRLADQYKYMLLDGIAILGTGAEKFGAETGLMISPLKGPDIVNSLLVSNPFIHPTVMWDRAALPRDPRYNDEFRCEEDYELWSRIVERGNCANIDYSTLKYRTASNGNANHPQKKRLNQIVLTQFASRFGVLDVAPISELSEFQVAGYIDAPGYSKLAAYAKLAHARDLPRLGWLQEPLLNLADYREFFSLLNDVRQFTPYQC